MASFVSYAGVLLPLVTKEVTAAIDQDCALEEIDTLRQGWPDSSLACSSMGAQPRRPRMKLGMLFDPAGASRPAIAKFIGSKQNIDDIRSVLNTVESGSSAGSGSGGAANLYQTLHIQVGGRFIERQMRLLPPKPIGSRYDTAQLYVLTFVDSRYDAAQLMGPTFTEWPTWTEYLEELHAVRPCLGAGSGDLSSMAMNPAESMWSRLCGPPPRWPAAVEAAAVAIGGRFAQGQGIVDAEWSRATIEANLDGFKRFAGGKYDWSAWDGTTTSSNDWLRDVLPTELQIKFRRNGGDNFVTFTGEINGRSAPWLLVSTGIVCACSSPSSGSASATGSASASGSSAGPCPSDPNIPQVANGDSIQQWVDGLASSIADFMSLGFMDAKSAGIYDWTPDGVHDLEFHYREGECYTRIYRGPFCDGVELIQMAPCQVSCQGRGSGFIRPNCILVFPQDRCCNQASDLSTAVWYLIYMPNGNEIWHTDRAAARLEAIAQEYPLDGNGDPCFAGECPPPDNLSSGTG